MHDNACFQQGGVGGGTGGWVDEWGTHLTFDVTKLVSECFLRVAEVKNDILLQFCQ